MDGSIIDLKNKKIVLDPNKKFKAQGYWNDPNAHLSRTGLGDWGRAESPCELLDRIENGDGTFEDPNLSPESIRYWKKAREESKKLVQNMTDEQKQLLDDLNSGKLFPLSRLVDEK